MAKNEKQKALDEALGKINKKFGVGTVTKASEAEDKLIKTFRKYKNVINVAHNKYRGKEKNYDVIITLGR